MKSPKNHEQARPLALAIVNDRRRRGGVRVCRVEVCHVFELVRAAEVEERNVGRTPHWLPFARLSTRGPRSLAPKLRAALVVSPPPAEPADPAPDQAPEHPRNDRANGYQPEPDFAPAPDEKSAAALSLAGAGAGA